MKSTIILSAIFSSFRFGDQVLFSLLGIGGRKKQRGARERHAYLLARTFFIAPYFDVDILNSASILRSGSLLRCQKQKDKRLWTDYSRLDIMHHLRYDGTYRLSLFMELSQGVDVNYVRPVCCLDMFRKDLSMAAESTAILSTAR